MEETSGRATEKGFLSEDTQEIYLHTEYTLQKRQITARWQNHNLHHHGDLGIILGNL